MSYAFHHPKPDYLAAEDLADIILSEQSANTAAFHKLVRQFKDDFKRLSFPAGFPAPGYDEESVLGLIDDLLETHTTEWFRQQADDLSYQGLV